ncbi:MAG: hypothetical protein ACJKSS_01190 [Patescibacteria group bacterium UBA2103]
MKLKLLILLSPFVFYGIGYLILNVFDLTGICPWEAGFIGEEKICGGKPTSIAWALKNFSTYLLPIVILLLFSTKETIRFWLYRFTIFIVPVGIIIFTVSNNSRTLWPFIPDSITFSKWFGIFFFITSALIIFLKNLKRK